jgi:hypothetical protein
VYSLLHRPSVSTVSVRCGEGQHAAPTRPARRLASMRTVRPHYIGPFDKECCHCHALHWLAVTPKRRPQFADCCRSGEVQIPTLDPIPADLRRLYEANDTQSIEFQRYIRSYNNSLAFTSTGGSGNLIGSSYNGHDFPTSFNDCFSNGCLKLRSPWVFLLSITFMFPLLMV